MENNTLTYRDLKNWARENWIDEDNTYITFDTTYKTISGKDQIQKSFICYNNKTDKYYIGELSNNNMDSIIEADDDNLNYMLDILSETDNGKLSNPEIKEGQIDNIDEIAFEYEEEQEEDYDEDEF